MTSTTRATAGARREVPPQRTQPRDESRRQAYYTKLLVLYVHLFMLEGALRKWVPGAATPLYLARDVIFAGGLVVGALVLRGRHRPRTGFALGAAFVWIFVVYALITAAPHGLPPTLIVIGVKNYVAPLLPLAAVLMLPAKKPFALRAARLVCGYGLVELALSFLQVNSPLASTVNRQVDGSVSDLTTADHIVRASGSFTAPAGLISYVGLLVASAILLIHDEDQAIRRKGWVGFVVSVALVAISGSRGAVFTSAVTIAIWIISASVRSRGNEVRRILGAATLGLISFVAVEQAFPAVLGAFGQRFIAAGARENTLGRIAGSAVGFFSQHVTGWGSGVGSRSNVAANLGVGTWIESDAKRWVAELGVLGLLLAAARLVAAMGALWAMFTGMRRRSVGETVLLSVLVPLALAGSITTTPSTQAAFGILLAMFVAATTRWPSPG